MPPLAVFSFAASTFDERAAGAAGCGRVEDEGALFAGAVGCVATFFSSDEVQLETPPSAIKESTIRVSNARRGLQNGCLESRGFFSMLIFMNR